MTTTITTSPLPTLDSPQIEKLQLSEGTHYRSAYEMILRAEQHAVQQQANENIVSARVIGYLLLEFYAQSDFFGDGACASIVRQATSPPQGTSDNEYSVIFDVGKLYHDKFIRLFQTSTAPYPPPSSHPSHPSFDTLENMIKDSMDPTGKGYRASRKKALARDGYRCMITGLFNGESLNKSAVLLEMAERDGANGVPIQACHILSESMMQGTDPCGISEDSAMVSKTHYAAGATALLESFGFSDLTEAFIKSGVHQVWNLLSLEPNLHYRFNHLDLWFERTHQPNRYKVCVFCEADEGYIRRNFVGPKPHVDGAPMAVEFNSEYEEAPPPAPLLLALHATCARVAHMSGAAEFFDQLKRDAEETKTLAFDGSSARLLNNLISPFAVVPGVA